MDTAKAFQSSLLRLVILSSTGLAAFVQEEGGAEQPWKSSLVFDALDPASSSSLDRQHFTRIRQQIRSDAVALFTDAGKRATNLSLALKRSAKSQAAVEAQASSSSTSTSMSSSGSSPPSSLSVLDGLDKGSIDAAQQTIDHLTNDLVPKLVFLAQKAWKEKAVYVREKQAETAEAKAERKKLEIAAKEMGGQLMSSEELGLGESGVTYQKQVGLGLGVVWSSQLKMHVQDVLQSIAALAEACMSEQTRLAVQAAKRARDRFDGSSSSASIQKQDAPTAKSASPAAVRQLCLSRTAAVWEACDLASKSLPEDEVTAIRKKWTQRKELMEDGVNEVNEALEESDDRKTATRRDTDDNGDDDDDDDDDDFGLGDLDLSGGRRTLLQRLAPLLRMGRLLHDRIGETYLVEPQEQKTGSPVDLDALEVTAQDLAEAQDDLVAALLYGDYEVDGADEDEGEDADEDEGEDEDEDVAGHDSPSRQLANVASEGGSTDAGGSAMGHRLASSRTLASRFLDAAQRVVEAATDEGKAKLALEDMSKVLAGITEEEWQGEFQDDDAVGA
ncbi:unnamed protein product [Parajaminaea phylloscopi]